MYDREEMEMIIGMTRSEAMREEHPPPHCEKCGSMDVEIEPEEKEDGFVLHKGYGECNECGHTWRA